MQLEIQYYTPIHIPLHIININCCQQQESVHAWALIIIAYMLSNRADLECNATMRATHTCMQCSSLREPQLAHAGQLVSFYLAGGIYDMHMTVQI